MESLINRISYLNEISELYGVPFWVVCELAEALGPNEDRDGLISELEVFAPLFSDVDDCCCPACNFDGADDSFYLPF